MTATDAPATPCRRGGGRAARNSRRGSTCRTDSTSTHGQMGPASVVRRPLRLWSSITAEKQIPKHADRQLPPIASSDS
jgi:hypothetical protein